MKTIRVIYDSIIIGAGPSGVQAGLYLARANKKVLVFHDYSVGALLKADKISNFYGQSEILGTELYNTGIDSLKRLNVDIIESLVTHIEYDYEHNLYVVSDNNVKVKAKTIILAMGKQIKNNSNYKIDTDKKISYCATCDGFFYRNKKVALIGNSEYTFSEYTHLKNATSHITLLTNSNEIHDSLKDITDVNTIQIKNISLTHDDKVQVEFYDKSKDLYDGVFIAEGHFGTSAIASTLGVYVLNGWIVVNDKMSTNVPGVFACGDIIGGTFQIAKAVSDGMQTGFSVINYLNSKNV